MNTFKQALIVLCFLVGSAALLAEPGEQPEPKAMVAAEAFLKMLDEAKWQRAYDSGAFGFDFSLFEDAIVIHRKDRGDPNGRTFVKAKPRLGMPGDETVKKTELVFETVFPDGVWTESVALISQGDGPWQAEGYTIGPRQSE